MRTITKVINPAWSDAAHTSISCQVAIAEQVDPCEPPGFLYSFNCMASDREPHGQQLWQDLTAGKYGPIAPYVTPTSKPGRGPNVIA
jgi:hypothetical protein